MLAPTLVETVGALAATLTTICWLPQAIRTIRTRETRAISLLTQAIFAMGLALWLVYGIGLGSWPIIVANALTLGLVAMILALKLRYG
jgi:MtN3 and saliva related transmembrane protein